MLHLHDYCLHKTYGLGQISVEEPERVYVCFRLASDWFLKRDPQLSPLPNLTPERHTLTAAYGPSLQP